VTVQIATEDPVFDLEDEVVTQMPAQVNLAVDTLYDLVRAGGFDFSSRRLGFKDLPGDVVRALKEWVATVDIAMSAIDPTVYVGSYFDHERRFYAFTFESSAPEAFHGTLIIGTVAANKVGVIGVSSTGSL
jgi:hypothetical protein